ncbi:MAG: NAD-dependent malic enzyme [Negativicutes bacterium]|nr:NAD-dependent malic enzyme [Negativicutes bacterium]
MGCKGETQSKGGWKAMKKGYELLQDCQLNKGNAFSEDERRQLGLVGLLPEAVEDLALQRERCLWQYGRLESDLARYEFLSQLVDYNQTLFYSLVMSDPPRFLPVIYTPTVGEGCLKFHRIYRRPRGMYISLKRRGQIRQVLQNWPETDVGVICVTNGARILGLGDIGANGMGIPIGKLQLYTACAGVPPRSLLPVVIDAGTNNEELLNDPLYMGLRQKRCSRDELYEFTDEFVEAVQEVFPGCCIQFEDWAGPDAIALLARYQDKVSMFNDDIQGTAAVMLTTMTNACRIKGTRISDERYLFLGAGAAAIGLSDMLCTAMVEEGLTIGQARQRIRLFDSKGMIVSSRADIQDYQRRYAFDDQPIPTADFCKAVKWFKPTVLVGVSTVKGAFTREILEEMSANNERPVILPMSNPTSRAECTAEEAYQISGGRVIFGAGVQFPPVNYGGKTYIPSQANNFYIFPAVGLAAYATRSRRITDEMLIVCARAVADMVSSEELAEGRLLPPQTAMLETEVKAAARVAGLIFDRGLAAVQRPADIESWLWQKVYRPEY